MVTFTEGPRGRPLTTAEQDALAKVENGYVRMSADGELLIIDDTAYFRHQDEQRRRKELAAVGEDFDSENDLAQIASEWPMSRSGGCARVVRRLRSSVYSASLGALLCTKS